MEKPVHIDLFSGIGGFALAAGWAGFDTRLFCEIDDFCQQVLRKNFAGVPIIDDIRCLTADTVRRAGNGRCDLVTAGFPCQDISVANPFGKGLDGERSGLWSDVFRLVCEIRPRFVVLENVPNLRVRGMGRILAELACVGYDAQWHSLSAASAGAPHERERVFLIAYPGDLPGLQADTLFSAIRSRRHARHHALWRDWASVSRTDRAVPASVPVGVDDGLPNRMDRVKALGNAICPQVAYPILAAIREAL